MFAMAMPPYSMTMLFRLLSDSQHHSKCLNRPKRRFGRQETKTEWLAPAQAECTTFIGGNATGLMTPFWWPNFVHAKSARFAGLLATLYH